MASTKYMLLATGITWLYGSLPFVSSETTSNMKNNVANYYALAIADSAAGSAYTWTGYGPILEMSKTNNLTTKYIFV